MGASGVKMLLYYHPQAPQAADREGLVRKVARDCAQYDIPFFLEPLSYASNDQNKPVPIGQRRNVVIETARRLVPLGVDILKAEFPVDVGAEPDENIWRDACRELTSVCEVPWVLLSAGVSYDTFVKQVRVACKAGASGVMAGRAVWKEAVTLERAARNNFLKSTGYERMKGLKSLCEELGRPFTEVYHSPEPGYDWYL
jgi:tagatose-1,6-bisphosphate aldolase